MDRHHHLHHHHHCQFLSHRLLILASRSFQLLLALARSGFVSFQIQLLMRTNHLFCHYTCLYLKLTHFSSLSLSVSLRPRARFDYLVDTHRRENLQIQGRLRFEYLRFPQKLCFIANTCVCDDQLLFACPSPLSRTRCIWSGWSQGCIWKRSYLR